jgi:group I intron endonuclease
MNYFQWLNALLCGLKRIFIRLLHRLPTYGYWGLKMSIKLPKALPWRMKILTLFLSLLLASYGFWKTWTQGFSWVVSALGSSLSYLNPLKLIHEIPDYWASQNDDAFLRISLEVPDLEAYIVDIDLASLLNLGETGDAVRLELLIPLDLPYATSQSVVSFEHIGNFERFYSLSSAEIITPEGLLLTGGLMALSVIMFYYFTYPGEGPTPSSPALEALALESLSDEAPVIALTLELSDQAPLLAIPYLSGLPLLSLFLVSWKRFIAWSIIPLIAFICLVNGWPAFEGLEEGIDSLVRYGVPALKSIKIYSHCHEPQVQAQILADTQGTSGVFAIVDKATGDYAILGAVALPAVLSKEYFNAAYCQQKALQTQPNSIWRHLAQKGWTHFDFYLLETVQSHVLVTKIQANHAQYIPLLDSYRWEWDADKKAYRVIHLSKDPDRFYHRPVVQPQPAQPSIVAKPVISNAVIDQSVKSDPIIPNPISAPVSPKVLDHAKTAPSIAPVGSNPSKLVVNAVKHPPVAPIKSPQAKPPCVVTEKPKGLPISSKTRTPVKTYRYLDQKRNQSTLLAENKHKCGVYRWINIVNRHSYVGASNDLSARFTAYLSLPWLKKSPLTLSKALVRYGWRNFELEIIAYCSPNTLAETERFYFDQYQPEYNQKGQKPKAQSQAKPKAQSTPVIQPIVVPILAQPVVASAPVIKAKVARPAPLVKQSPKPIVLVPQTPQPQPVIPLTKEKVSKTTAKKWTHSEATLSRMRAAQSHRSHQPVAGIKVQVLDLITQETCIYNSLSEAASALEMSISTLSRRIKLTIMKPYHKRYVITKV